MKKIIVNLTLFTFILLVTLIMILLTIGIKTNKFNNLISKKAIQTKNINLELDTIKFKIDPKELSLFLETQDPKINYSDLSIPIQNIKIYIDFLSLLKSDLKTKKINLVLKELDINHIKKLSSLIKPSNFKSLLKNKIKTGNLISEIAIFFDDNGFYKNFITKGVINNLEAELFRDLNLTKTKLSFFADKNDVLIKNIYGDLEGTKISDGDIKINFENGVKLVSNFNSKINIDKNFFEKKIKFFEQFDFYNNIKDLQANLNNNFSINFDDTYKVKDYNYDISGKIKKGKFELSKPIVSSFITKKINKIYFSDLEFKAIFVPKQIKLSGVGKYSINNLDFFKINLENNIKKNLLNLKIDLDYKDNLVINLINYKKSKNSIANLYLDLEKKNKIIKINKINYEEGSNLITINDLRLKEDEFLSFKEISVKTLNNDFLIQNEKKIYIKGKKFDATNLAKILNNKGPENKFKNINSNIEIDFNNIKVPMSEKLQNFKLIGEIKKGKFVKISSKGDFGGNNFLDISLKKGKNNDKKYLEIYSDLTRPLLTEYSFFNGLSGGKLLFTSIINGSKSDSNLKIENFKVINAPGVVKLLSLADLGGLADLAEGDGLSFDILEISMQKENGSLKLSEILALGQSMSVLMEGYQDENGLTSLRGTLVPAKTLNKIISKIPVIGDIIIPKEAGEGLFGISFKMKGPKGKVKTTINPIRTLTPRFIQKIVDRRKKTK